MALAALIALGALAASAANAENQGAAAQASPALWRISDEDSVVYLFGAVGIAPDGAKWRSRALARAIDASEVMWFEAPVDEPAAQAAANSIFAAEGMLEDGKTLFRALPDAPRDALAAVLESAGLSQETLDPLKPWAAFVVLSSRVHPGGGESVDAAILKEARSRGRDMRYFDRVEDTLRTLTEMPGEMQVEMLAQLAADFERQRTGASAGFEAWRMGDLDALDAYLNAPMRDSAPEVYNRLVTERAQALAGKIAALLNGRETAFVSLNASFTVGEGSLPERLAGLGLNIERVAN